MKLVKDEVLQQITIWTHRKAILTMSISDWTYMISHPHIIKKPDEPHVKIKDDSTRYLLGLA